jgi:hypothetical protein
MKLYTITADKSSIHLLCEAETKKGIERENPLGPFSIGDNSKETWALAAAIMQHYFGASPNDPVAIAEAEKRTIPFMEAFLLHHQMDNGAKFEISSDVIDKWIAISGVRP